MEWLAKQEANFEKNRFGAMTIMITFQSCLGSIAAMMSIQNDSWVLVSIVAVLTMISNSMFIAQADAKSCLLTFYLSVVFNAMVVLFLVLLF